MLSVCTCKCLYVSYRVYIHWALQKPAGAVVGRADWFLSGAEVRRQRQEHRPGCLDLLCLSACFVTMQYRGGGGEGPRLVVHRVLVFWDSLASGSLGVFDAEQRCFHCGPEGSRRTKESIWQARSYVLICHATYKHSRISPSIPFHTSNPWQGLAQDEWLFLILRKEP